MEINKCADNIIQELLQPVLLDSSPANFGDIEGQLVAACVIPIKRKLIRNAFKILRTNFMKAIVL